ncbi:winged helix DNA-binding domain-containing protein [Spirosoma aureum]|uniref:Winged helix DNA-binding domain-containing protein n=1 Tax=Spirosoma aureum TaxID=2692134 RepID=A0A6G9ARC3_9BACT|nr:winged helix DNA-binding domain-containing protein [Spirosoma aureum]QIP14879.1 winged helix DNA-binding domain-containing protein [Spirosoma aureum]
MTDSAINQHRLASHQITQSAFTKPVDVVTWFGAMQAQDFLAAKWALGLRLPGSTEGTIEQAIADRSIIRTWAMRGTLHLIAADDIRWLLNLLRPRLYVACSSLLRKLELDEKTLVKSYEAMARAMQGGKQLIRSELKDALEQVGIQTHDLRINGLLVRAAFDGLICCGVRRGSENTYTLLDEWVPATKSMGRDEALAELTKRYFMSHGPATIQDFVWWSGLTVAEAKTGLSMINAQLAQETTNGKTYWSAQQEPNFQDTSLVVHLLPSFDEYLVGYKDRSAALGALDIKQVVSTGNGIFNPILVIGGRVVGTWKRTVKKNSVSIDPTLFYPLTEKQQQAFAVTCQRYGHFKGLNAVWPVEVGVAIH